MGTKFVISSDGTKIAYSIIGKGPALLLVHGGAGRYDKSLFLRQARRARAQECLECKTLEDIHEATLEEIYI